MTKCGFIRISIRIAKIRTPKLAHFALCNSTAWLNARSDAANVAAIPISSRAAASISVKGNDVRFLNTLKQGRANLFNGRVIAENQKHKRAAKSVCSFNTNTIKNASFA